MEPMEWNGVLDEMEYGDIPDFDGLKKMNDIDELRIYLESKKVDASMPT